MSPEMTGAPPSRLDPGSPRVTANQEAMAGLRSDHQQLLEQIRLGGSGSRRAQHQARGKLLVRERIHRLLDHDSPFFELSPFAAHEAYPDTLAAAGIVTGVGLIHRKAVMIVANDATVKGGTYYPLTVKKHLRAQEIAARLRLPCLYLVDSGGAFLPRQDEVFPDRDHFGRIFFNQANLSAAGIPQLAAVMGSCTAGGAYIPAMSDQVVMVKGNATIFLAGPPLVKAATGEVTDAQALGGADLHCRLSGVADYQVESEQQALDKLRELVSYLPTPQYESRPSPEPAYPAMELGGIVGEDIRYPIEIREVILRLCDGSEFDEFKPLFGKTLVCGFGRIGALPVGIVANNGVLHSDSALKGTHFIDLCGQRQIPLLFLQNVTGFMVGTKAEAEGIAKHGAKMVTAVACARVPKFTIIVGGSFGAGNYAMCGRAYDPLLLLSWPNSRTAVMGAEQATRVLAQLSGGEPDQQLLQAYRSQSRALYGSARLWDDGIILPEETRPWLRFFLELCHILAQQPPPREERRHGLYRF